jgi:acyl-coenzyme A thioesterase PaaI-like protein
MSTVTMTVHYLSTAPGEGLVAHAHCTRRGRNLNYVVVKVESSETGKALAQGMVTVNMTSRTPPVLTKD